MKTKQLVLSLLGGLAILGLIAGCSSAGYEKAADTATSLTKASDGIVKGNALVDQTLAALNDLVNNPKADLRKQFGAFNDSVNDLTSTAKDVDGKAKGMKSQGADYFKNWDKQMAAMKNEDIRNRSEARKGEVASKFGRISQSYDETRAAFAPFMSDLRDVQKFLSTDLTAGGLSAIKDVAAKANKDAGPLKESLTKLSEEFKGLGLSMSPATGGK
jgi:Protein of unknown function (DUF2959)